jgi:hypothetical protein
MQAEPAGLFVADDAGEGAWSVRSAAPDRSSCLALLVARGPTRIAAANTRNTPGLSALSPRNRGLPRLRI